MAVEQTLPKDQPESSQTPAVRELLKLLVKAQKARRLYQARNAISDRLQNELFAKISAHLEEVGSFILSIREFQILLGEELVYESRDRNDSLAFILFRDGVRRLSFHEGLEEDELQDFLKCLNRVALLTNEQDDLVTLFWEKDFKSIKYYAVEELTGEVEGPRLEEQLASGSLEGGEGGGAPADAASMKDVEQPVAHLPVEACRLREEEIEALRTELAKEGADPFGLAVVELAIELALLETSEDEKKGLAEHMVKIVERLLAEGELGAVAQSLEHLVGLTRMAFGENESVQHLNDKLVGFLSGREQLQLFFEQTEAERSLKPAQMTAYLAHLGKDAIPALIPWMGRLTTAAHRRAIADAVLTKGEIALEAIDRYIPPNGKALDGSLLREVLYILTHLSEEKGVPIVERLMGSPEPTTRRETMQVLGRFQNERVDELCLKLLSDEEAEVRSSALDTLVRRGNRELAKRILDESDRDPSFDDRRLSEKRRIYAAVAKLGKNEALKWFVNKLQSKGRRWFASRKEREACEATVHGIRVVGTKEAWRLLHDMAEKGDRYVRAACVKELSVERGA